MASGKIDMYREENNYHVVFHDVTTNNEIDRIKDFINAYRGVANDYSEYFPNAYVYEEDPDIDTTLGTQNIIPEGKFKGCTIQDAYDYYGHYSLSILLQTVLKMKSQPRDSIRKLYVEVVQYAVPLILQKEIPVEDFISAYRPFLANSQAVIDMIEKDPGMTAERADGLYNGLINDITGRMVKSTEAFKK